MNKSEFYNLLERHDWYYDFSDDRSVYARGKKTRDQIMELKRHDPELQRIYQEYVTVKLGW